MKFFFITFRSVTYAQRGEKLLNNEGIRCNLQRTPRWMEEQGCGYALKIWEKEIGTAVAMLRRESIPLRRVYAQRVDGQLEEMRI